MPVGRPQTIPIDLSGVLGAGERQVRIVTNMRIYWDRIAVGRSAPTSDLPVDRLDPRAARLSARGFSLEVRSGPNAATDYLFERVSLESPWKAMAGAYTREGDVGELLTASDDMFVIVKPGDEIALEFDAERLTPLAKGFTRTFLLKADGYSKEMDINSASPDTVEPLPFHGMSGYPYGTPERYPETRRLFVGLRMPPRAGGRADARADRGHANRETALIQSVFRSAARRNSVGRWRGCELAAPVTEKRIGLNRYPDARLWRLNDVRL